MKQALYLFPLRIRYALLLACALFALAGCGKSVIAVPDSPTAQTAQRTTADAKNAVVRTARSQIGTPYKSGGQSPGGFDCSGLVTWAYKQHGFQVPRTTSEQTRLGRKVERAGLQAGDILVFRTSSGLHTGIYSGRGTFIHSPKTGEKVREDALNNVYWNKVYREARRVL